MSYLVDLTNYSNMKKKIIWTDELVQQYAYFYCSNPDWKNHKGTPKSKEKLNKFKNHISDESEFMQGESVVNSEKESVKTLLWQDFRHVPECYNKTETLIIKQSK